MKRRSLTTFNQTFPEFNKARIQLNEISRHMDEAFNLVTASMVLTFKYQWQVETDDEIYSLFKPDNYFEEDDNEPREWVTVLETIMNDQDYPVPQSNGEKFCDFFELNPVERKMILTSCATDEQYQEYCDYENRNSVY